MPRKYRDTLMQMRDIVLIENHRSYRDKIKFSATLNPFHHYLPIHLSILCLIRTPIAIKDYPQMLVRDSPNLDNMFVCIEP